LCQVSPLASRHGKWAAVDLSPKIRGERNLPSGAALESLDFFNPPGHRKLWIRMKK